MTKDLLSWGVIEIYFESIQVTVPVVIVRLEYNC